MNAILTKAKAIAALVGALLTALAGVYGTATWFPVALAVVTAVATYAVPNAAPATAANDEPVA